MLDVTGMPMVDSSSAQALQEVANTARLLGTDTILVGIRPEVAQTIVQLGLQLEGIRTYASLQEALYEVLQRP
jgi:rsbT co-antagonist protein RsbR